MRHRRRALRPRPRDAGDAAVELPRRDPDRRRARRARRRARPSSSSPHRRCPACTEVAVAAVQAALAARRCAGRHPAGRARPTRATSAGALVTHPRRRPRAAHWLDRDGAAVRGVARRTPAGHVSRRDVGQERARHHAVRRPRPGRRRPRAHRVRPRRPEVLGRVARDPGRLGRHGRSGSRRQLVDAVESLRVGWPTSLDAAMGPLIEPPTGKLAAGPDHARAGGDVAGRAAAARRHAAGCGRPA